MTTLNVLGFTGCYLDGCDCGARVVLGATRATMRDMVSALQRAGFVFEVVNDLHVPAGRTARPEPLTYEKAHVAFMDYVANTVTA